MYTSLFLNHSHPHPTPLFPSRFDPPRRLMELLFDVQQYGQPPAEIMQDLAPGLMFDEDGMPIMPNMGMPGACVCVCLCECVCLSVCVYANMCLFVCVLVCVCLGIIHSVDSSHCWHYGSPSGNLCFDVLTSH